MTPEGIQQKIFFGYAKAAQKLGATFNLYRATSAINPLQDENLIGQIQASTNVSWSYMKANRYGNALFQICIDAQSSTKPDSCQVGDFLIPTTGAEGVISDNTVYFIASLQFLLPPQAVSCNRTVSIVRPTQGTGAGYVGYAGRTQATDEIIVSGMPMSVIAKGKEASPVKLPTDKKDGGWTCLIPNVGGIILREGDIIKDEFDQQYVISSNELTDLGWRLTAEQVVGSR